MAARPDLESTHYRWCVALLLAGLLGACGRRESAATSAALPARVVALTPSCTEIVAAVGGLDRLVGVDRYSDHPAEVRRLPVVGDFLSPSFETILRLRPDLVVLDQVQSKILAGLEAAGVRALAVPMHTLDDVRAAMTRVGAALGTSEATRRAVERFESSLAALRQQRPGGTRPRVLLVVDRQLGGLGSLVAAGPGSYLDELLQLAGGDNALAGLGQRYAQISAETILRARPDVILDAVHTDEPGRARRDWAALGEVPAVAGDRVHILADRIYVSPGPRAAAAVRGIAERIRPR
jgi:iron complex transport system substrate-binding protein